MRFLHQLKSDQKIKKNNKKILLTLRVLNKPLTDGFFLPNGTVLETRTMLFQQLDLREAYVIAILR
jgi:hypothetical protein